MPTNHILPRSMEIGEREAADLDRALDYLGIPSEADAWDMECELRAGRRDPEASPATRSIGLVRLPEGQRCGICAGRSDEELPPTIIGFEKWARICNACDEGWHRIVVADVATWTVTR